MILAIIRIAKKQENRQETGNKKVAMLGFNSGKLQWKVSLALMRCVIEASGTVFGGAVRDNVRHCHVSNIFYDEHPDSDYNDPFVHRDKIDRMLIPNDIDCFFGNYRDVKRLESRLRSEYDVEIKEVDEAYTDLPDDMSMCTFVVRPKINKLLSNMLRDANIMVNEIVMSMDVIWCNGDVKRDMPFNEIDFECNALIFNKSSLMSGMFDLMPSLSPYIVSEKNIKTATGYTKLLNEIMKDIGEKRAVIMKHVPERVFKMSKAGWKIKDTNVFQPIWLTKANAETCLICLGDACQSNHYMRKCCKAHYCKGCIQNVVEKCTACPQCRAEF